MVSVPVTSATLKINAEVPTLHLPFTTNAKAGLFILSHWPHRAIWMRFHRFFFIIIIPIAL